MVRWLVVAFLAGGLCVACADRPVAPYPKSPPPAAMDSAVGPGDLFEVRVYGEPSLSSTYEVSPEGSINFPLIGAVAVAGKSPPQIEKDIQGKLAAGYIKNPSVSVRVTDFRSRRVSVFGQVRQPGTFPFTENMSIVEAVAKAGGFTAMAKKNAVRVTRGGSEGDKIVFVAVEDIGQGKSPNFYLRPGDVIYVDERIF
jgi:polysaccharide export outer membrane protein